MLGNIPEEAQRLQPISVLQDQRLTSAGPPSGLCWRQEHRDLLQQEWGLFPRRPVVSTQALEHLGSPSRELQLEHISRAGARPARDLLMSITEVIIFKQTSLLLYLATVWPWAQILNCEVYDRAGPQTSLWVLNEVIYKKTLGRGLVPKSSTISALCDVCSPTCKDSFLKVLLTSNCKSPISSPAFSQNGIHAWQQMASFLFILKFICLIIHWGRVSLLSPSWLWTGRLPVSASWGLGWQKYATAPGPGCFMVQSKPK